MMAPKFTSQDYHKITFPLIFHGISWIILFLTIDFKKVLVWNAIETQYLQYGLSLSEVRLFSYISYWLFHFSPMHLGYISILFLLGIRNLELNIRQQLILIFVSIMVLPLIVAVLIQLCASILLVLGIPDMKNLISNSTYIGTSMVAWGYIGTNMKVDKYIIIAFLFPLLYKIMVSHLLDFTPDIAHICGFCWGLLFGRITSRKSNLVL